MDSYDALAPKVEEAIKSLYYYATYDKYLGKEIESEATRLLHNLKKAWLSFDFYTINTTLISAIEALERFKKNRRCSIKK